MRVESVVDSDPGERTRWYPQTARRRLDSRAIRMSVRILTSGVQVLAVVALVLAALVGSLLWIALVVSPDGPDDRPDIAPRAFDSVAWKADAAGENGARTAKAGALVQSRTLIGKTRPEVGQILGHGYEFTLPASLDPVAPLDSRDFVFPVERRIDYGYTEPLAEVVAALVVRFAEDDTVKDAHVVRRASAR